MRHLSAVALVAALAAVGCEKPQEPKTAEPAIPTRPMGELRPVAQPETAAKPPEAVGPLDTSLAPTPQPEVTAPPTPTPSPPTEYTVRKGDTLWSIAERLLGSSKRWPEIVAANPGIQPRRLPVGRKLTLPPR